LIVSVQLEPSSLRHLRTLFAAGSLSGLSDGELLERFVTQRDDAREAAFAALVQRHGAMVLRTCRGILGNRHDAEDATQATFFVLARSAGSIRRRTSVASWLYRIAWRVSARVTGEAIRRRAVERRRAELIPPNAPITHSPFQCPELIEELSRLPENFRAAIVLIDLEGCTQVEAAARLCWPLGTVQSRLARGRNRLRTRLLERGIAPTGALLVAGLTGNGNAGTLPMAQVDTIVRMTLGFTAGAHEAGIVSSHAIALAEGVLKTMLMARWNFAGAAATVFLGAGILAGLARADRPGAVPSQRIAAAIDDTEKSKSEAKAAAEKAKLKGTWKPTSAVDNGREEENPAEHRVIFDGDSFTIKKNGNDEAKGKFTIDVAANPKTIDMKVTEGKHEGESLLGIYAWDGDSLKWCTAMPGATERPSKFASEPGSSLLFVVFEKEKP
jgi:RNA polymerase sigma factor (sigma-70 family)